MSPYRPRSDLEQANEALLLAGLREQELAERATNQSAQLNALLEGMTEGVTLAEGNDRVILVNPAARRMLGFSDGELSIEDYRRLDLRSMDQRPIAQDDHPLSRALRGESFSDEEVLLVEASGVQKFLTFSGSAVRDARGEVTLAITMFRDVTKLRELEVTREEYVSLVSHDLRGPLTAAKLSADRLATQLEDSDRRREHALRIARSIDRADRMLRDLLDVQRIRAGQRLLLSLEACDLGAVMRDVAEELRALHGDRFVLRIDGDVRGIWSCRELRRALWNLGSNAVKYGAPDTPVSFAATRLPDGVALCVHNQGPVIPAEEQSLLFKPFTRLRTARGSLGWGLGLTLVQASTEAHGGRVSVCSEPDRGTTFTLELPLDSRPFLEPT